MLDTAPVVKKRYREKLMRLSPEQSLLPIRASSAGPMDDETLRRELFLRLYGREVPAPLRKMVLEGYPPQ